MAINLLRDRGLLTRTSFALLLANIRYWTSVAPIVRAELKRWQVCAAEIEDSELRALAFSKLRNEGFHADAAAMLATLAPRTHRRSVVEAIVALELLFDYLDGLTERPSPDPLHDGERLFRTLLDAIAPTPPASREHSAANGYPEMLSRVVALALARLPATAAIAATASRTASRTAQAQTRIHAVPQIGTAQLEEWATSEPTELGWRELAAGAGSSVLVLHALIAAAANPRTTAKQATQIERAYLSTCVMLTLLDGLVDYEQDLDSGSQGPGYIGLYEDREQLTQLLCQSARRAVLQARALSNGPHHVMLLTGVVAYYSTAPGAGSEIAKPAMAQLKCELAPLISPTLALMRTWRRAKRRAGGASSISFSINTNISPMEGGEESP
jgi:tetraprenyl-beta-curcumene synthase